MKEELHPSHDIRISDASTFDVVCKKCGHTDHVPGGWGELAKPCSAVKNSFLLIKFEDNYADEFDVHGFFTSTTVEWEAQKAKAVKYFEENSGREIYFGTNEYCEYESAEQYLSCFEVEEITEAEYKTLQNLFGSSFGTVLDL